MSRDAHTKTSARREFAAYLITNARNGKRYVGITINGIEFRLRQHFYAARAGGEQTICHAIRAYGEENFSIRHIASAVSHEQLLELEKQLIAQFNTYRDGYNMTVGGEQTLLGEPIIVDGVEYLNANDAADQLAIKSATARARMKRGWMPEQAFGIESPPPRPSVNGTEIEVDGEVFLSATQACKYFGIDRGAYLKRIKLGWTKEQAFGIDSPPPPKPVAGRAIKLGGSEFPSIAEACRKLKVDYNRTRDRVAKGWGLREVFDLEEHSSMSGKVGQPVSVADKTFPTHAAVARHYGVSPRILSQRMRRGGLSLEQALGVVPLPPKKPRVQKNWKQVTIAGKQYDSVAAACRAFGVKPERYRDRIERGWTPEEAFDIVEHVSSTRGGNFRPITVDGKRYSSFKEACDACGVIESTARMRIRRGWPINEVFGLTRRNV